MNKISGAGEEFLFLGEHNLTDQSDSVTFVSKAKRTENEKHPQFFIKQAEGILKYDVAILELETPIDFRNYPHIRCRNHSEKIILKATTA